MREEELINELGWTRSREAVCPAPAMGAGASPAHVPTHIPAHVPAHTPPTPRPHPRPRPPPTSLASVFRQGRHLLVRGLWVTGQVASIPDETLASLCNAAFGKDRRLLCH